MSTVASPHVVLVTVDSLRLDALGVSRPDGASTPHLDTISTGGAFFTEAITNGPRTPSAFPAILASISALSAGDREGLPADAATWAEAMRDAGYRTLGLNPSNPFITRETGYDRGFDSFIDFWDLHDEGAGTPRRGWISRVKKTAQDAIGRKSLGALMLLQALFMRRAGRFLTGSTSVHQLLDWMDRQDAPCFGWLHLMDLHFPYQPLPGERGWLDRLSYARGLIELGFGRRGYPSAVLRRLYDRRVELIDRLVAELHDGLEQRRLLGRTLLILTSDHGERFGTTGEYAHGPDLCEELLRVPLVFSGPGVAQGVRVECQVGLVDLAPTVLDMLDVPAPASFQGRSFRRLLRGESGPVGRWVFSESRHSGGRRSRVGVEDVYRIACCRGEGWKLVWDEEGPSVQLYHVAEDPNETENLIHQRPDIARLMQDCLADHLRRSEERSATARSASGRVTAAEDEELRRRLAALGYL